jgi:hypothetical protein
MKLPPPELYGEPKIARLALCLRPPFFRHRLNHMLSEISLQILSYRMQISTQQARNLISKDQLDFPEEFLAYFKDGLPPWPLQPSSPGSLFRRWKPGKPAQDKAIDKLKALDFLENLLECQGTEISTVAGMVCRVWIKSNAVVGGPCVENLWRQPIWDTQLKITRVGENSRARSLRHRSGFQRINSLDCSRRYHRRLLFQPGEQPVRSAPGTIFTIPLAEINRAHRDAICSRQCKNTR